MNLIQQGKDNGLIKFDEDEKYITYIFQRKQRNFTNPEEKIQVETFLKLILVYGYSPERIRQFVPVSIGAEADEADIIVYNDDDCLSPHIIAECKKEEVSEPELVQALEQAFSCALAQGAKYVWTTSGIKNIYYEIPGEKLKQRIAIPDIPQYGVDKPAKFKYAKGGGKLNGQKIFELERVSEDELTRRFKHAHQSLWGGGELNPSDAFDELDKLIFCKIWDENRPRKKGEPYDFQIFREDTEEETAKGLISRIKTLYEEGRRKNPEVFREDIRLSPEKLRTVVAYLESVNMGDTDLDSKGRAFETFMGSFFRGNFGQFFTPRAIVKFIVDVLPITKDSLVLDTSCGSGGFLLHALDKVKKQADENHPDETGDENTPEGKNHYRHWQDFAEKNLFGIEINEQIARVAKMNMILHGDGHGNIIAADGLLPTDDQKEERGNVSLKGIVSRTGNHGFAYKRFDFIITNPPFGSTVKQTEHAYMRQYGFAMKAAYWLNPKSKITRRERQNTEILFIEQCHRFLREGGYLAIVVPDGILTNSRLQYVRDDIEENYRIAAVVSMPRAAFQATGAGVKSSVLFLKKRAHADTEMIRNKTAELQENLRDRNSYLKQLKKNEKEKADHIRQLRGFENAEGLEGRDLTASDAYKEWKKKVGAEYAGKTERLKEILLEQYAEERKKALSDYPIFMAVAEHIGYDATGKEIPQNDLPEIAAELSRFVQAVENGQDDFFV